MRNLTLEEVKSNVKGKMAVLCSMFCETQPLVSIIPVTRVSNERGEALSEKKNYPTLLPQQFDMVITVVTTMVSIS